MASGIGNKKQLDKNKNKRKASIIIRMRDGDVVILIDIQ